MLSPEATTRHALRPHTERRAASPHIVWVYLVFYPDGCGASQLWTGLFRRLAEDGARVTVLSGFPAKDVTVDVASLPRSENYHGIAIERCGERVEGKRNLLARAIAYSSFLVHASWRILQLGRQSTVVGGTDPPFTPITLWLLSRIGRFGYELILTDIYPDGLVGIEKLKDTSPLTRLWRALNRRSYLAARRITVIGRDMVTRLERQYGIDPAKVTYIPHWGTAEVDRMHATPHRPLLERLGLQDKFVVQYSGNMGLWHDMDALVRAAHELRDDRRIHFLFVGKGRRRYAAQQLSQELGLSNITWLDFLPPEQLTEGLSSCDAALISFRKGLEGVAVPSKLYGILASGRPIVAQVPRESEVGYTVAEEQCGFVVGPGDVAGLVEAIRTLAADPCLTERMGANAVSAYRSKYTIDCAAIAFKELWQLE
jgi:colanic acid biosynthesis glycosyl transferase WcaI